MSLRHSPQDFMLLARKAYDIYKAINDRQESVPRQLQLLGDELRHLDERLRELCRALEQHETSTYDGYDAFKRTLDECQDFVDRFIAFNRPGAIAVRRWLSIGKYTFDYDSIKSLQLEAAGHVQYIIFVQNNLALATVSELLKRRKEIMHMGPEAEPTRTNFQLNVEIDELATRIEAILARTLLPPLQRDVTDNRVEIPSGAGEQAAYGQKWTLNAVLQQPHQPDDHPETSGLPELHTRPFVEDLASSVKARNTLRVRGSVSQLMDRLAFSRHNSRDEDGLRELSGIAVEAQQLLSRSRDSQKRTAIQSTDPNKPALMTLLSAVPVKFRTSDMKRGPMDCGVDICSDGFNFSLTVSLSNGVKYVEYLQDAPIPHVEYPDDDRPRVVSDRDTSRVVSVSFPGRRNVYRESPQTPTQRIEVDVKYFFGSERRSYEFQEKIYGKKLLECVRVDSVKLDGRIMCQIQPLRIWMGRNGICTAMFFANSLKEKKGRLYLEYEIIGAEPVKLVKKAPVRLHVAAESETGDRKPNIHQRRTSFTPVLSTASKKSTSSVRKTSRSELTLDVVVTSACDRRALKRALQIALKDDMTYVKNLQTPQSAQESSQFHVYWRNNVNIEIIDYGSLPPPHTADYELDRTATKPPIFRTALAHFIQHPLHAPIGVQHLKRMSKKVGARVTKTKHGKDDNSEEELEGWGLHVRERVCWKQVSIVLATLGSGSLAFAIVWCVKYGVGLQDGFTVAGVMVAYGTIILGVLHSAALTQSQSHS
ncbi:MAG: hypothetical protein M1832_000476 [Thelocarpon impressellum]|nr:MAG: hypothetical protein M1832_000476 [Thelocarpon impressellum]